MSRYDVQQFRARCEEAEALYSAGDLARACGQWELALEHAINLYRGQSGPVGEAWGRKADTLMDEIEQLRKEVAAGEAAARKSSPTRNGSAPQVKVDPDDANASDRGRGFRLDKKPSVKLAAVAGMEDVKRELRQKVLQPMGHPEVYRKFKLEAGAGVLMYGPPGNGKTFVAKAIAGEVDAAFFSVDPAQIKSKYVGESAKNLTALFEAAWAEPRAVIFLDECDGILGRKGNQKIDTVTQFLTLADGIRERENCLLILAATNRPWAIDPAVLRPGRIGTRIYVGLPDRTARLKILETQFPGGLVHEGVTLGEIADRTEGFSGADLAELVRKASQSAVDREIESGNDERITRQDLDRAMSSVQPSCTPAKIRELERWRDSGDAPDGAMDVE